MDLVGILAHGPIPDPMDSDFDRALAQFDKSL